VDKERRKGSCPQRGGRRKGRLICQFSSINRRVEGGIEPGFAEAMTESQFGQSKKKATEICPLLDVKEEGMAQRGRSIAQNGVEDTKENEPSIAERKSTGSIKKNRGGTRGGRRCEVTVVTKAKGGRWESDWKSSKGPFKRGKLVGKKQGLASLGGGQRGAAVFRTERTRERGKTARTESAGERKFVSH